MGKLDGKVAIITGAAQGMGASHAQRFIEEGAKVVITDLNEGGGRRLADELGENALFLQHDVTSPADWRRVVHEAEETFGPVTVLVNNAGVLGPISETVEFAEEEYLKVCAINQHSQFYGMKAVIPSMRRAGGGAIVNISSTAGLVSIVGAPNIAYVGSKFASRGMTKHAAVQYGPDNIRVNSVHPGHQNAHDGCGHRRKRREHRRSGSATPHVRARGGLQSRSLPGLRRLLLHQWHGARHRRWTDRPVETVARTASGSPPLDSGGEPTDGRTEPQNDQGRPGSSTESLLGLSFIRRTRAPAGPGRPVYRRTARPPPVRHRGPDVRVRW